MITQEPQHRDGEIWGVFAQPHPSCDDALNMDAK